MAAKLSTCFLSGWSGVNYRQSNIVRFCPSCRLLPASCNMRHRNFSSQHKKQARKVSPEQLPTNTNFQPNDNEDSESEIASMDKISSLNHEQSDNDVHTVVATEDTNEKDLRSLPTDANFLSNTNEDSELETASVPMSDDDVHTVLAAEDTNEKDLSSLPLLKKQARKVSPEQLPTNTNFQPNDNEDSEPEIASMDKISSLNHERSDNDIHTVVATEDTNEKDVKSLPTDANFLSNTNEDSELETASVPMSDDDVHTVLAAEDTNEKDLSSLPLLKKQARKVSPEQLPTNTTFQPNDNEDSEPEIASMDKISSFNHEQSDNDVHTVVATEDTNEKGLKSLPTDANFLSNTNEDSELETASVPMSDDDVHTVLAAEDTNEKDLSSLPLLNEIKTLSMEADSREELSSIHVQDLIGMIRNAEKNILLLNQARFRALEDLEKILNEKHALQGQINILEMRLAETDARIRVAAQEKIHVERLEDQLEKLRNELSVRGDSVRSMQEPHEAVPPPDNSIIHSLNEEINLLRKENMSQKDDLQALKSELSDLKGTDDRVLMLEKQRSSLESFFKELELKLDVSQEDVSKLSTLKFECKNLWEKVEHLQALLDKATKQADQAISVLQQNQELRKKVDRLEESIEEANVYKSSSEKLQQYNELMQQKIKLLEERLQRSDEEIRSYVQLYQESVTEFQDTLNSLKEESKRRALDEPVDDMPWEFWSRLLLMIDGWFLEKKISANDAKLLREMAWKRDGRICDAYMASKEKNEHEAIGTFLRVTQLLTSAGLHVIHIAAEMAPVAKVGGLGDVVTGLGKALQQRGHLVEIILPKYDCMQHERIRDLRALDVVIESYFDGCLFRNKVWVGTVEGLPVYFIEPHHPGNFFWRGQFYGEHDDFKRFSFFSRAALELLLQAGKKPDIIHCHDWQTAFVAPLYWDLYVPKGLNSARICFTCHNFEYQGTAPASELASCGLDVYHLNRPDRMQDISAHDRVNPVKGAIVYSNIVTTVSPTYAQEVRSAEEGRGLQATLKSHSKKFIGILNGIDTNAWNPSTDNFLQVQYSAHDLQGKAESKEAIRRHLGLASTDARQPLVGCITRLVPQKGVHLIRHAIYQTMELGGQFVLLGSSPVPHIQREFEDIANRFQSHEHVRLLLKYDESLSHLIYAACDMFIIPSIFEPCGLTQMIAMRYGSIPIARKTGGLNDSVFDFDDDAIPMQFRNGFTFLTPDEQGVNSGLERAFKLYKNNYQSWQQLVQKVMNMDFSWDSSALQYEELYEKAVARARAVFSSHK